MEAVRRQHAVERARREAAGEVARRRRDRDKRKAIVRAPHGDGECTRVAVDGRDVATGPEEVGEGQGEGAVAGAQLEPAGAGAFHACADEGDVVAMIHALIIAAQRRLQG
jgi:hypothetical protein